MISILIILLIVAYIVCGVLAYGIILAYQYEEFLELHYCMNREFIAFSVFCGLLGFIGLVVTFLLTGFAKSGWRLK